MLFFFSLSHKTDGERNSWGGSSWGRETCFERGKSINHLSFTYFPYIYTHSHDPHEVPCGNLWSQIALTTLVWEFN